MLLHGCEREFNVHAVFKFDHIHRHILVVVNVQQRAQYVNCARMHFGRRWCLHDWYMHKPRHNLVHIEALQRRFVHNSPERRLKSFVELRHGHVRQYRFGRLRDVLFIDDGDHT